MTIVSDQIVTEWLLNADQHKRELSELYKQYRQQEAQESKNEFVRKKLSVTTDDLSSKSKTLSMVTGKLESALFSSLTAANLASTAIGYFASALSKGYADSNRLIGATNLFSGSIDQAKEATKGLVSELDLMQSSNRLNVMGVRLNSVEYAELLSSVRKVSKAMGTEFADAMGTAEMVLGRHSQRAAKSLGLFIDTTEANEKYASSIGKTSDTLTKSEKAMAFQMEAMAKLKEKADALPASNEKVTDSIKRLTVALWDATTSAFAFWNQKLGEQPTKGSAYDLIFNRGIENLKKEKQISELDREFAESEKLKASLRGYSGFKGARDSTGSESEGGDASTGVTGFSFNAKPNQAGKYAKAAKAAKRKGSGGKKKEAEGYGPAYEGSVFEGDLEKMEAGGVLNFEKMREGAQQEAMGSKDWSSAHQVHLDALAAEKAALEALLERQKEFRELGSGALADFSAGLWSVADASIASGENFALGMAKLTKATLLGIAQQATAKAVFYAAEALATTLVPPLFGSNYWAAAATMGKVALVSGAAGLALSAGMRGATGEASGGSGGGGGGSRASGGSSSPGPVKNSATSSTKKNQPLVFNVYLGDPMNGSAAMLMAAQLKARVQA